MMIVFAVSSARWWGGEVSLSKHFPDVDKYIQYQRADGFRTQARLIYCNLSCVKEGAIWTGGALYPQPIWG